MLPAPRPCSAEVAADFASLRLFSPGLDELGRDADLACKGLMHGAFAGDLEESRTLIVIEIPFEGNGSVHQEGTTFALGCHVHVDTAKRPAFSIGVHLDGH